MKTGKTNKPVENTTTHQSKRTFTTDVRGPWQDGIRDVLRLIDTHNSMAMIKRIDTDGDFHARQSSILRQYVINLKEWIRENENNTYE